MLRSEFQYVNSISGVSLTIRDLNRGKMSVTNDVENVVRYLLDNHTITPAMKLYYYDSDNELDEIVFDASGFKHFTTSSRLRDSR